jgi:hypothetical protein
MITQVTRTDSNDVLDKVFARLREIVEDGVRHGYFECAVSCEIVNGKRRRLVITSGKSHQFTISEDDLAR